MACLSVVPLPVRHFLLGGASGVVLSLAALAGLIQLGAFPKESDALVISADYRLSREETRLREHVRYLEQELELLRPQPVDLRRLCDADRLIIANDHIGSRNGIPDVTLYRQGVPAMDTDTRATELREAASRARAFALSLESTELKQSFFELADKWEAEARTLETMH